jgi:NADH-quinone oxidoreductase subunit F
MEHGLGDANDLSLLMDVADNINGKCFCPLGDAAIGFLVSAIKHFQDEFEAHVKEHRCPLGATVYDTANY